MTEVVLVRHGATSWSGRRYCGRSDPPLHEAGLAGVIALAQALAPTLPPDILIVTSPLGRARETAAAIAVAAGVNDARVEVDERWLEADFGIAEGRTFDELAALAPDIAELLASGETAIDWPGGETAAALGARVEAAWIELLARVVPALVVSHGGPLRHALAIARSLPPSAVELLEPAAAARVKIGSNPSESATVLTSRS
jgi:broad specificity phosphatase PhoE